MVLSRRSVLSRAIASSMVVILALAVLPGTALASDTGSTVLAWGNNHWGEVGDGTTTARPAPVQLPGLTDVSAVAAGYDHSLALRSDGRVLAWGSNARGQLGDPSTLGQIVKTPTLVPGLTDVVRINAYLYSSVAVDTHGTVWEWGQGLIAGGTPIGPLLGSPTRVQNLAGTAVAAGAGHRLAVAYGTVRGWGENRSGQQGDGTTWTEWRSMPGRVLDGATAVAGGVEHTLVLRDDRSVWSVGRNDAGQLGDGTQIERHTPARIAGLANVVAVDAADRNSMALRSDGTLWAWGDRAGAVGDEVPANVTSPRQIAGVSGVTGFDLSGLAASAITSQGVWSWGRVPGNPNYSWAPDPLLLPGTAGATDVARGFDHGLIVLNGAPDASAPVLPPPLATTVTVDGPAAVPVNEPVAFTATVSPSPGGGTMRLTTDGSEIASAPIDPVTGTVTLWTTFYEERTFPLVAEFPAVSGFEASSKAFEVKVGRTATTTEIIAVDPPNPVDPESPVTVTARVTPTPDEPAAVVVYIDGRWIDGAYLENGVGRVAVGTLPTGSYSVVAEFIGNDTYVHSVSEPYTLVVEDNSPEDTTPPAGTVSVQDADGYSPDLTVPLELTASDDGGSGVAFVEVSRDEQNWERRSWPLEEPWGWTLSDNAAAADGSYVVYARFSDAAGNVSETTSDSTIVDRTAPTLAGHVMPLVRYSDAVSPTGGVPVNVRWPAGRDAGTGIDAYVVERSLDGGAWTEWDRVDGSGADSRLETRDIVENTSARYRVTAVDVFGRRSATITGARLSLTRYQESSTDVARTGRWTRTASADAWGGATVTTTDEGATLKLRFTGRGIYWVAPGGAPRGRAEVSVDGKLIRTVDLGEQSGDRAVVFAMEFAEAGEHTIRIRCIDGLVEADGFIAARW